MDVGGRGRAFDLRRARPARRGESREVDHAIRVTAHATDRTVPLAGATPSGGSAQREPSSDGRAVPDEEQLLHVRGSAPTLGVILTAMKRYGMIVADNGSDWFFTGTAEHGWSNDMLDELKSIPAGAFEAIDESSLMVDRNSGRVRTVTAVPAKPKPKPKPAASAKPTTPAPSTSPKATRRRRRRRLLSRRRPPKRRRRHRRLPSKTRAAAVGSSSPGRPER